LLDDLVRAALLLEGVAMLERSGKGDKILALALGQLAALHVKQGDRKSAIARFEQAIEVARRAFGPDSAELATARRRLAPWRDDHAAARSGPVIIADPAFADGGVDGVDGVDDAVERPRAVRIPNLTRVYSPHASCGFLPLPSASHRCLGRCLWRLGSLHRWHGSKCRRVFRERGRRSQRARRRAHWGGERRR
jgi:hypothetical protein